jgi:hypothetical protein
MAGMVRTGPPPVMVTVKSGFLLEAGLCEGNP